MTIITKGMGAIIKKLSVSQKAKASLVKDKLIKKIKSSKHKLYKKIIKRNKRFHAHDENSNYNVGDNVAIQESRPFSKLKRWIVLNNLDQGEQQ